MRRLLLLITVAWALSGCQTTLVRSDGRPTPTSTASGPGRDIGSGLQRPSAPRVVTGTDDEKAPSVPGAPPTSFVLVMVDENGLNPSGIPIEIRGAKSLDLVSDATGKVLVQAPAGRYTFTIPTGCGPVIDVRAGQTGEFGIAEGQSAEANVRVDWRHRYAASGPVFPSVGPYWPPGRDVRVRFDVIDLCGGDNRAPNAALAARRIDKTPNIEVLSTGNFMADGEGYGYVTIRCASAGETRLELVDSEDPRAKLDLAAGYGADRNQCGEFQG